ncbi:MAG: DNA-binding GntR family transcriptional regulator [Granulosicoccus sp.]|jgi:DNA-binding GntR family transcriptional regulator
MYDPASPVLRVGENHGQTLASGAKARFAEDRLLDAVIWCELLPGATVTEVDVMERFGLTRAATRAGLMRLGYDGWATPQARQGWQVLPITGALIGQVLDARRIAEPGLSTIRLTNSMRQELTELGAVAAALSQSQDRGAVQTLVHYVERIDSLLLGAINPLTARHLRMLWHHSARITRFLEDEQSACLVDRTDALALVEAALVGDTQTITALRLRLIDAQESFFLRKLLLSEAPLTHRSERYSRQRQTDAANFKREL